MKNAVSFVSNLPANIRTSVLYSVVGSLNASLVGSARAMVQQLESAGYVVKDSNRDAQVPGEYDLKELSPSDVEALFGGPATGPTESALVTMRTLNTIVDHWRDDLQGLVEAQRSSRASFRVIPQLGSSQAAPRAPGDIMGTIDMMSKPRALTGGEKLAMDALASALQLSPEVSAKLQEQNAKLVRDFNERSAKQVADHAGAIEWMVDHVFQTEGYADPEEAFEALDEVQQDAILAKVKKGLETSAMNQALRGIGMGSEEWSAGDVALILKYAEQLDS